MKFRRFISILLGLALIGVVGYRFYEVDMNAGYDYLAAFGLDNIPDMVNTILLYAFLAFKVLAILFIAIGSKGTLIAAIFFLPLGLAGNYLANFQETKDIFNAIISFDVFQMDLPEMFETLVLPIILIFWLLYLIFVSFGVTKSVSAKIILLIVGLAPVALFFVDQLLLTGGYSFDLDELMDVVILELGVCFLLSLMLLFNQKAPKKASKDLWIPVRETIQ